MRTYRTGTASSARLLLGTLVAGLLAAGFHCASLPGRSPGDVAVFSLLEERSWRLVDPVRTFGPDTLYEEIDGEAELFLPYAFRKLDVGIVAPSENGEAEIRLELFLHGSRRDAFGIYSQHRFPGQEMIRLEPSEAILSDTSLDFFQGDRFVRLRAGSRKTSREDLLRLGKDLASLLPGLAHPPRETEVLQVPGLVEGTTVFNRRAVLGYEFLAPGYEAEVRTGNLSVRLVLLPPPGMSGKPRSVEHVFRSLPGFSRIDGSRFRAELPSGLLWLSERGGYAVGVGGEIPQEQAVAILSSLERNLVRFLESCRDGTTCRSARPVIRDIG